MCVYTSLSSLPPSVFQSLKPSAHFFTQLSKVLKLSKVQEVSRHQAPVDAAGEAQLCVHWICRSVFRWSLGSLCSTPATQTFVVLVSSSAFFTDKHQKTLTSVFNTEVNPKHVLSSNLHCRWSQSTMALTLLCLSVTSVSAVTARFSRFTFLVTYYPIPVAPGWSLLSSLVGQETLLLS